MSDKFSFKCMCIDRRVGCRWRTSPLLPVSSPCSQMNSTDSGHCVEEDEEGDSQVPAASVRDLPCIELDGVWDTYVTSLDN